MCLDWVLLQKVDLAHPSSRLRATLDVDLRSETAHKHSSIKRKRSSTCTEWVVAPG